MPNLSFTIGSVTITPFFWSLVLAVFFSSFSIWRKLKDDFKEDEILKFTLISFISALFFSRIIFIILNFPFFVSGLGWFSSFAANLSPAGAFWGIIISLKIQNRKLKKNIWEIFDSFSLSMLYFLFMGGAGNALKTGRLKDTSFILAGILGFLFFSFWKKKYRSWPWYKSGKTGFLFWSTSFYTFFALLVLALCKRNSLYFEELGWTVSLIISLGVIYYRSERNFREDFKLKTFSKRNNG